MLVNVNTMYFLEFICGYFIGTRAAEFENLSSTKVALWVVIGGYAVPSFNTQKVYG